MPEANQRVFEVEQRQNVLIITPMGPSIQFRYREVHLQTNDLYRELGDHSIVAVIVYLGKVDYLDSIIISSILRSVQRITNRGGGGSFCAANEQMLRILQDLKIGESWPYFETLDEALESCPDKLAKDK